MILISPRKVLNNAPLPSGICLNGTNIKLSQSVRNLGVTLDQTLSFQQLISDVFRTCHLELRRISTIYHYLSEDATKTLICAFVLSRLDDCNALLSGFPKHLDRLKKKEKCCSVHLPVVQFQSRHTSSPYSTLASNWKKGLISNSLHIALNLWLVLPLPTS